MLCLTRQIFEVGWFALHGATKEHYLLASSRFGESTMDRTISELLYDDTIPQHYKTVFQQQTKIGWEHLFMGKMASIVGRTTNTSTRVLRIHSWNGAEHAGVTGIANYMENARTSTR